MVDANLADRLLIKIAEISRRSDVVLQDLGSGYFAIKPRWKKILPPDMLAFYEVKNGLAFHFSFEGEPAVHGFRILAMSDHTTGTFDPISGQNQPLRGPAGKFPKHFFQPNEIPPETEVLFFFGSDDAAGIIMLGQGESATFRFWDNDGFTRAAGSSFTELMERMLARGFADTWEYEEHSGTDAVVTRLATEVPPRITFELRVETRTERSAHDYRVEVCRTLQSTRFSELKRHLGVSKALADLPVEQQIERLAAMLGDPDAVTDKKATSVIKDLLGLSATKEDFRRHFAVGSEKVVDLTLVLRHLGGVIPLVEDEFTLIRALHDIDGLEVTKDFPGSPELLRSVDMKARKMRYRPYISVDWDGKFHGEEKKLATFHVCMAAERAVGLEPGRVLSSTGLPSVERGFR